MAAYTHGWSGFVLAYAFVGLCMLPALKRAGASQRQYLTWPVAVLPTLLVAALAQFIAQSALKAPPGTAVNGVLTLVVFAVVGFVGGHWWAVRGRPRRVVLARGTLLRERSEAARPPLATRPTEAAGALVPLTLATVPLASEDETRHIKILGATGTGKSTVLRELLHGALARGDRAIIADPDGGYLSRFYDPGRGDVILNPFDARSRRWDLFAEIRSAYDIEQLARSLIPERGGDTQWPAYARTFFESVTRQAQAAGVTDLGELYQLLTSEPVSQLRALLQGTAAAPFADENNLKMFFGVRSTAAEHVKSFDYICQQPGAAFSVREWVCSGRGVLFLPYQADQIAALRSTLSTWMRLAIFQTMSLPEGDQRLWFVIDELDALGAIDGLPDALARLRKFGGRCALGLQSIAQASTTYGSGPAQAMVENCGNTLILRCSASEGGGSARFASQLIGEREVIRSTLSFSRSAPALPGARHRTVSESRQHTLESAVLPSEIEQLPDRSGFLKLASEPAWTRVQFPVHELPIIAAPFVPAGPHGG